MWRAASVLMVGLTCNVFGQQTPQSPADIVAKQRKEDASLASAWLQSPLARLRAWGAYLVLRDRLTDHVLDLLALLQDYQVNATPATLSEVDDHNAMLAVLDAVIQLHGAVPVDQAAKLYPEFRAQSIILLAHASADATEPLLRIFRTEQKFDGEWVAAGNLLVTRRTSGFAAAVLSGMTVRAVVTVTSGSGFGMGSGGGVGGGVYDRGSPADWPEIGTYSMTACDSENGVVLVPGIHSAFYIRWVNSYYLPESGSSCLQDAGRDEVRADYVASLLGSNRGERPLPPHVPHSIVWTSDENYLSQLRGFIDEQGTLYRQVGQRLHDEGLLSESEMKSARPRLEININDARAAKNTALPTLPDPGDNVVIGSGL